MCDECWSRRDIVVGASAILATVGLAAMGLPTAADAKRSRSSGAVVRECADTVGGHIGHRSATNPTIARMAALPVMAPRQVAAGLSIYPREAWGADLPPTGAIAKPEDVRFLLVHHTASPNTPPSGGTPTVLRETYAFQTSSAKGWPDVCYEFFVDGDGLVWEGRAGALDGPVVADATGGSQGFAQLVCLIGDFTSALPTPLQQAAFVRTLAWLADRYHIDTTPGATASFVSRGSQRWPAGSAVTARTISGHRDMSMTECPGNAFYPIVHDQMQALVSAARATSGGRVSTSDRQNYRLKP